MNFLVWAVISWTVAFILVRKIFSKRSFNFCNRIVSTLHASLAVTLCSLTVEDWGCPVCPLASKSSPSQMKTLAVTLGYLIYDLICCLFDNHVNIDNIVHHLVSILGIGAGLVYERILFAVIFTLARMVAGPHLTYVTLSADNPLLIKAMAFGLQLVSAFWFYKIARMVRFKLTKRRKSLKET
ncbi:TLC domain-containing protein 5-like isoform X2 [Telopea speciosissima]|uniref:TLC domain-containing protein 5-like isoform X2 n=1 Tax=Telopea speciosissima TaxID=54955 RepID=UPI001CC49EC5|nr:TLC domain-containing protein 5-like isoform X2 [Telopea speciosissima]